MAVKILVIGAGSIGRRHHENLTALGADSRLRGWRGYGAEGFAREIAEVDAAVIATETALRLELIALAADAGKALYIEKPLAYREATLAAIADAAAPVATRSMLGYMMRYHPAFLRLAEEDRSGIFQASFAIGHDVTQWRQNWRFSESYAAKPEGGGVLLDLCHELDMAHCLFPQLKVQSVASQGHASFPGVDMASHISLTGGGIAADVAMDYLTPQLHRRTILRGSDRLCDFDFAGADYRISDSAGSRRLEIALERNQMFLAISRDFLSLCEGRAPSANPFLPRLDLALPSARLTAEAWEARRFIGMINKEIL